MDAFDVAIIGGGLAGLTLALQLRATLGKNADIVVIERNRHPVCAAAHKVGESTVEIGAHYLADVVGLRDHLESQHLPKLGLRFFFGCEGSTADISTFDEIGASSFLPVRSYQVDRGILENALGEKIRAEGVTFLDGCVVRSIQLGESRSPHRLTCVTDTGEFRLSAAWVVDAASRASPLRTKLALQEPSDHANHAAWFRLETALKVDGWSSSSAWQDRCKSQERWLSTNHFMGPGYWVWLIPLSSGCTSVGIVADPAVHPTSCFSDFSSTMRWLREFQPTCWNVMNPIRDSLMDFRFLRRYSHGASEVFSPSRWALTGEAGVFLDPFYSPGTDFIGISNTFITELIRADGRDGGDRPHYSMLQDLYLSFYRSTLDLYLGQYPGFGDFRLMACKTTWDYSYYWAVLARLFFTGMTADRSFLAASGEALLLARSLNQKIQRRFRERASLRITEPACGRFLDQCQIPCLWTLNASLMRPATDLELRREMRSNVQMLTDLSRILISILDNQSPPGGNQLECSLTGDMRLRLAS